MNNYIPVSGDFVRVGLWVGIIRDVFISDTSSQYVLQIQFVKNAYKQQPPELHILGEIKDVLFPASAEEFEHEAEHYKERIQNELEALMLYRAEAT